MNSSSYKFAIPQDATVQSYVGQVSATGDAFTFAITTGGDSDKFNIDQQIGVIRVDGSLSQRQYTVYVTPVNQHGDGDSATVTIMVAPPLNISSISNASWKVFDHIPRTTWKGSSAFTDEVDDMSNRKTGQCRTAFWKVFTQWLLAAGVVLALAGCEESEPAKDHTPRSVGADTVAVSPHNEVGPVVRGSTAVGMPSTTSHQKVPLTSQDVSPVRDQPSVQHSDKVPGNETASTVLHNHQMPLHYNAAARPLEERILKSQVIVRARLLSAQAPDVHRLVMEGKPLPPHPILTTYRFKALEYLKGAGPAEFEVAGQTSKSNGDWNDGEALLFLITREVALSSSASASSGNATPSQALVFASVHEDHPDEYAIDSLNPVWLPAARRAAAAARGSQPASTEMAYATDWNSKHSPYQMQKKLQSMTANEVLKSIDDQGFILDPDAGEPAGFVTLQEIKDTISWVKGDGTPEYDHCVERAVNYLKHYRDIAAYFGEPWRPGQSEEDAVSGSAGGSIVADYGTIRESGYPKNFLTGENAELFQGKIVDNDTEASNGFKYQIINRRPLPFGNYAFTNHSRRHEFKACGFAPVNNQLSFVVSATAPVGTLHEAFFDPAAIGQGVGANSDNGVLQPTAITAEGYATTIKSLVWQDKKVIMTLSPYVSLLGQTLDFIALDGTTALSLEAKSATVDTSAGTLAWSRATRPWSADDRLMLRLHGPTVSIMDASGMEGKAVDFQVALSEAVKYQVRVSWKVEFHGSAKNYAVPNEHWKMHGELVFQPGQTSRSAEVFLNDDDWLEDEEVFLVILSNPKGATIADGKGTMTIIDDD